MKRLWKIHVPGYPPFQMISMEPLDEPGALAVAKGIRPFDEVRVQ
jgi:hypothetical protein